MFQCDRVILKRRMEVGLRGMAGIARLREKREVRQLQIRDDTGIPFNPGNIGLSLNPGMREHQTEKQQGGSQQRKGEARFSCRKSNLAFCNSRSNQGS